VSTIPLRTFGRGGLHVDSHKEGTASRPIERLRPAPREVWLPLAESFGPPLEPVVKKGDVVSRGQKVAEGGPGSVPVHATISGKVKPVTKKPHPTLVTAPTLVIDAGEAQELEFPEDPDWPSCPREEALARIREAGVVGLGGAAFPTFRKLDLPAGSRIDTLLVNGSECEPYLTSDYRTMIERATEVVEGSRIMARILGVKHIAIGIEADKLGVLVPLGDAIANGDTGISVDIVPCEVRYPQGAERQLVKAVLGRTVPARGLPLAVGVVVQNVATAVAVHDAVRYRKPLLDRVLTVTGPGVVEPRNVLVPIGTPLANAIDFCGGLTEDATRMIAGGPMMGRSLPRLDLPVIKGMNGLLVLTGRGPFESGYQPCVHCGRCLDVCPLGLEPDEVSVRVEAGLTLDTERFGALDCYECGCCTYVCPSERPLLQFMQVAKSALRRRVLPLKVLP
jgi:H+/Na+-translocating ferredoxin:NAD+ oxidoreductase subunit C